MKDEELLDQVIYEVTKALEAMKDRQFSPAIRLVGAMHLKDDLRDMLKGCKVEGAWA